MYTNDSGNRFEIHVMGTETSPFVEILGYVTNDALGSYKQAGQLTLYSSQFNEASNVLSLRLSDWAFIDRRSVPTGDNRGFVMAYDISLRKDDEK